MKETLYTIPLTDAFKAQGECPFCYIERNVEQDLLDFVLGSGSSYMESDVREATDKAGFCRSHFKKMFDYGNTLGNGWILKTHYVQMNKEFGQQLKMYSPQKASFLNKFGKNSSSGNPLTTWIREKEKSCYICQRFDDTYARYLDTFFFMYKKDDEMTHMLEQSKGLCLHHYGDVCEAADLKLNEKQKEIFFPLINSLMAKNLEKVGNDVSWLVEKFDYRNKDADWKDSKDAIQRSMQKLWGGYPEDAPYRSSK